MKFLEDTKYLFHVMTHPFDGFYEVRFRGKKNYLLAAILVIAYGLLNVIKDQYMGFIMNSTAKFQMNSLVTFLFGLFPILLFTISNWSVTAIFEGSGKIGDIFVVVAYALFPKIIFDIVGVIVSNFVIESEVSILRTVMGFGTVWFCYLVFAGLCVVHEYGVGTNIVTLIATFVAAIIIIFLAGLYISLVEKVISFLTAFLGELAVRW